jgi:hypothetical protein
MRRGVAAAGAAGGDDGGGGGMGGGGAGGGGGGLLANVEILTHKRLPVTKRDANYGEPETTFASCAVCGYAFYSRVVCLSHCRASALFP